MAFIDTHTPWREWLPFADWFQKLRRHAAHAPPVPKDLTPHQLELLRFEWPSDGPQRPMI